MALEPLGRVPPGADPREVGWQSLRAVIESNFDGMVVIDRDGTVLFANPAAERLLGRPSSQLVGAQFGFPHARGGATEIEVVADGAVRVAEMRVVRVEWEGTPALLASLRDVTDRKRSEEESLRLAAIVEQSDDAIFAFDRERVITAWNEGAERLLGYDARDALGQPVMMLVPEDRVGEERELLRRVLTGQPVQYETERVRGDRTLVEVSMIISPLRAAGGGEVIAASAIARDATERNRAERRLEHLATRDPLTRLLNRRAFETELARAVAFASRYQIEATLIMLDIDHFKDINDSYGHALGDATLRHVSDLLRHRLRETDIVGRLGGDELALILPGTNPAQAREVAGALLDELRGDTTIRHGSEVVRVTASIGLTAIEPKSRLSPDELLAFADIALYQAKEAGRNGFAETDFSVPHEPALLSRVRWADRIRDALEHELFVLHEQPIINLRDDNGVERTELLIRMRGSNHELVPPAAFLPAAKRFGQIRAIDRWVIDRALVLLREPGQQAILHVNLSGATVADPALIEILPDLIAREATDPARLAFEIAETVAIENIEHAHKLLQRLSALGCQIVLDDFGSGFGSFYYLKHLPFDSLKIDGEFTRQITTSKADRVIVQAIIEMARGLEKTTFAECVENQRTLELMRRLGVDYAQGFHLGKPAPHQPVANPS